MVFVWRLSRPGYATRLDGKGNVLRGARWNSPGRGVVYTSLNLSLSVLESLVQLAPPMRGKLPTMTAVRIEIPDEAPREEIAREQIGDPGDERAAVRCRQFGDAWLRAGQSLSLEVPSVIVPQERNVLINPAHPLMDSIQIVSTEVFHFDPRLVVPRI
jgi:RES domain-containing protein